MFAGARPLVTNAALRTVVVHKAAVAPYPTKLLPPEVFSNSRSRKQEPPLFSGPLKYSPDGRSPLQPIEQSFRSTQSALLVGKHIGLYANVRPQGEPLDETLSLVTGEAVLIFQCNILFPRDSVDLFFPYTRTPLVNGFSAVGLQSNGLNNQRPWLNQNNFLSPIGNVIGSDGPVVLCCLPNLLTASATAHSFANAWQDGKLPVNLFYFTQEFVHTVHNLLVKGDWQTLRRMELIDPVSFRAREVLEVLDCPLDLQRGFQEAVESKDINKLWAFYQRQAAWAHDTTAKLKLVLAAFRGPVGRGGGPIDI